MERQICGWEEGKMPRSIGEDVKGTCHQAAGRFTKTAAIMAITAAFIFSGSSITVSHGAEGAYTETIRKGFSGSLAVKENPISLAEVRQEKTATLARGRTFNESIKTMAAGKYRDTYRSDNLIKAVRRCTDADSMSGKEVKQLQEAGEPVYGWFEDGIIYFYTDADTVYLNEDCSGMFRYCQALGDFSGVSGFDAGKMRDGSEMFIECSGLITADSFSQWNMGNLEDMQAMFQECRWLQDITGLSNWDVSHVTNMGGLFRGGCFRSLEALSGWDTGMVENLSGIFGECYAISDLDALSGWDVGSVTGLNYAFETCISLMDVTGIAGWDTSKVESVERIFSGCEALVDASALSGWDTGSVTNMFLAFDGTGITDASLYPSWYSEYRPAGGGLSGAEYSMREEQREVLMATPGNAEPDNTGLIHGIASPSNAEKADGIPEADGAGIFSGSPMLP
jgi:bacterial surface protein 26-residue repeat/bacterial surface protein 26-residue repeat